MNFSKIRGDIRELMFITGVNDTGEKFIAGVTFMVSQYGAMRMRPRPMCPRMKSLGSVPFTMRPWTMRPLDDASLRRCVPWTMRPLVDASLGRSSPDRCFPTLDHIETLVSTIYVKLDGLRPPDPT